MNVEKRSPIAVVLLSLITCGIYALYWIYASSKDIQEMDYDDRESTSPGLELVLCLITCGLYTFFWYYKYAKKIQVLQQQKDIHPADDNAILYIVLNLFGLNIISMAIMQSSINKTIMFDANNY